MKSPSQGTPFWERTLANRHLDMRLLFQCGARESLVSWDKDLLDLMNEELPDGKAFRGRFPGLAILSPVGFLEAMRPKLQEQKEPERNEAGPSNEAASGNQ
jgi:hypothetical protein